MRVYTTITCGSKDCGFTSNTLPAPLPSIILTQTSASSAQQLQIEVAAGKGISQVTIWVDGNLLTTLSSLPYQAWWTLSAGEHRFWAEGVDANGKMVKSEVATITVVNP